MYMFYFILFYFILIFIYFLVSEPTPAPTPMPPTPAPTPDICGDKMIGLTEQVCFYIYCKFEIIIIIMFCLFFNSVKVANVV